jgi:hypothetical protein
MVAPVHNFDPKILLEGSAKPRWAGLGQGTSHFGGGGARSALFAWQRAQKDGSAQRMGAHARPKPTS